MFFQERTSVIGNNTLLKLFTELEEKVNTEVLDNFGIYRYIQKRVTECVDEYIGQDKTLTQLINNRQQQHTACNVYINIY